MIADNSSPTYVWVILADDIADDITIGSCILIPYDVDSGHGDHSGDLPLFVGYFVDSFVSHPICMFQDSVPAGSYNDPFLSSVIPMVTPTWCHRAN